MIYTGNNGRIYIARSQSSGLTGTFTTTIPANVAVDLNGTYGVRTVVGSGKDAVVRADRTVNTTQGSRGCVFTVISAGKNYAPGDVIRFYTINSKNVMVDVSPSITVDTTQNLGLNSEREVLSDQYRIAKIRSWSLTSNSEVIETTALGDVVRTVSPGMTSGEGSATLLFYEDDTTLAGSSAQSDIFELVDLLFPRGTAPRVVLNLAVDGSTSGSAGQVGGNALWKTNFLFNAYITSASVGVSYGEVVAVDTSFTIDGAFLDTPWKPDITKL
jgi:hypothetical protein